MRQFQCVPTTYVTKIKVTYYEIYTKQVSCSLAFSIKMTDCLFLFDSYITKFDFVNYAFAKLVVAWLYKNENLTT